MESWQKEHSGDVLCVSCSRDDHVASCGDDGIVLWNGDGRITGRLSEVFSNPVTNTCFGSDVHLYAASGRSVHAFDTRNLAAPLWDIELRGDAEDELNSIAAHDRDTYVAVCDDAGVIHVADVRTGKVCKTMSRQHDNVCSSVQFRPRTGWEIGSCGLDCKFLRWDFSRGRPLQQVALNDITAEVPDSSVPVMNPPMLHQLSFHHSGGLVALAAEDGTIRTFSSNSGGNSWSQQRMFDGIHPSSVCQVEFSKSAPDRLLLSAGNDCRIVAWNAEEVIAQSKSCGKKSRVVNSKTTKSCTSSSKRAADAEKASSADGASPVTEMSAHSVIAKNPTKINWMASSQSGKIFIADQTSIVKAYNLQP